MGFFNRVGSLSRRKKDKKRRPSSSAGTMVSASGALVQQTERKCSLVGKFIVDEYDRAKYSDLIKRNLPVYLNTAEKVCLKVNRNVLLVTDRSIFHNKVDRIPVSLITDCHVDTESPKICYFVSESINGRYQVLVFFCKTADDAYQLVDNCPSRSKTLEWYSNSQSLAAVPVIMDSKSSKGRHERSRSPISGQLRDFDWQYQPAVHSMGKQISTPSNTRKGGRKDGKQSVNFQSTVQQYRSSDGSSLSKADRQALQRNRDGIARIVVGGNESYDRSPNGLTLVGDNQNTQERRGMSSSLERSNRVRLPTSKDGSLQRVSKQMAIRQSGDGSTSPAKMLEQHVSKESAMREEEFRAISPSRQKGILRVTGDQSRRSRDRSPHLVSPDKQYLIVSEGNGSAQRRKGAYESIRDYEKQQSLSRKKGLMATSGSENIAPQNMTLVLDGNKYSIENNQMGSLGKKRETRFSSRPMTAPNSRPQSRQSGALQVAGRGGDYNHSLERRALKSAPGEGRIMVRNNQITTPTPEDIQPQQLSNQVQLYRREASGTGSPKYKVQQHGKGDNFMKNESLEVDDDHRFYRQHGQRVKNTHDGKEQLYLDQRLAETNDIIGDQMVKAQHAQKVHSGEVVGANHRSKFHSETKVSHQISQPTNAGGQGQANKFPVTALVPQHGGLGRQNSQPVRVTTHKWPGIEQFGQSGAVVSVPQMHFNNPADMNTNFHNNFGMGLGSEGMQRFYRPQYNPQPQLNFNPGFQRFFESIKNFGPQSKHLVSDTSQSGQEKQLAITSSSNQNQSSPVVEMPLDNASEASSIRSSASAYWPAELRFAASDDAEPSDANSWRFHKPMIQLRRKNVATTPTKHHNLRLIK